MYSKAIFPKLSKKAKEFQVSFTHFTDNNIPRADIPANIIYNMKSGPSYRSGTLCTLYDSSNNQMYQGWAIVNPKDPYRKNVGRRVSLNNALIAGGVSKEERQRIAKEWEKFTSPKTTAPKKENTETLASQVQELKEKLEELAKNNTLSPWIKFDYPLPFYPQWSASKEVTSNG